MEKNIIEEIEYLKKEINNKREKINKISDLINAEIDREFKTNPWELSEKELDFEMSNYLTFLNQDIDTRPDEISITSHRKIVGKFIVFIKKTVTKVLNIYTNSILEKQRKFNEKLVYFHLASFIRFRQIEKKIRSIDEKIKKLEENQDIIIDDLKKVKTILLQQKNKNGE